MLSRTCRTAGIVAGALTVIGLVASAGCSDSERDIVSSHERAARFKPANEAYTKLGYRHIWTGFPTMAAGATVARLDVLGDVVTAQDTAGVLSVLEEGSGLPRWSDQLGNPLTKFLGVARTDKTIVCSSEVEAHLLDIDTGTLVGKQRMDRVANTNPAIVGNLLVYGTATGEIVGQLMPAGFRAWGTTMSGPIEVNPARLGNTLGFVADNGEVAFFDGATGNPFSRSSMFMGTRVPPAASEDLMFVASRDQSLYAFSPASAAPVWRHRTSVSLTHRPVYHNGVVYCAINGDGLTAFGEYGDGGRGDVRWVSKGVFGYVVGIRAGRLVVWDGKEACLVDPENGDLIERARLDDVSHVATDNFVDGNLYLSTPHGVVVKLAPRK